MKSLAAWAEECARLGLPRKSYSFPHVLCLDCARAYAEEREAALRAENERLKGNPAWGEVEGLRKSIDCLEAENERLREEVYCPGHWRCSKCGFFNVRAAFNARTGNIQVGSPADVCPNDGELMQPVKWSEIAKDQREWHEADRAALLAVARAGIEVEDILVVPPLLEYSAQEVCRAAIQRFRDALAALPASVKEETK